MKLKYILFLLLPSCLLANTSQSLFEQANEAYTKGRYQQAIEQYETIFNEGLTSNELYYNLGNAYYKTNQIGKAILNFERALVVAPSDEDAAYNLALLNEQLSDDLDVIRDFFLTQWWQEFYTTFSSTTWSYLTILSLWLGFAGMSLWLLATTRSRKKQGFIGGLFFLLVALLLFFAAKSKGSRELHSQQAIVMTKSIELLNGPDTQSTSLLTIHEGLKVELLDEIGEWWKVKLSNGEQGWLLKENLEEI